MHFLDVNKVNIFAIYLFFLRSYWGVKFEVERRNIISAFFEMSIIYKN